MMAGSKTFKPRFVVFLLALVLAAAAVDPLPDPPAIQPKPGLTCLVSALACRVVGPINDAMPVQFVSELKLERKLSLFRPNRLFRDVRLCSEPDLIRYAANSSPPYPSLS